MPLWKEVEFNLQVALQDIVCELPATPFTPRLSLDLGTLNSPVLEEYRHDHYGTINSSALTLHNNTEGMTIISTASTLVEKPRRNSIKIRGVVTNDNTAADNNSGSKGVPPPLSIKTSFAAKTVVGNAKLKKPIAVSRGSIKLIFKRLGADNDSLMRALAYLLLDKSDTEAIQSLRYRKYNFLMSTRTNLSSTCQLHVIQSAIFCNARTIAARSSVRRRNITT
jgi:hypothetical protein